jgi:uroporphyrinogen decarboxylase
VTGRERVLTAIRHQEPDRVPIDLWAAPEVYASLRAALALPDDTAILDRFGVDLAYVPGPSYQGRELRAWDTPEGRVTEDLWGVRRLEKRVRRGGAEWSYKHVVGAPLAQAATPAEIHAYAHWPDPAAWDCTTLREQCQAVRAQGRAVVNAGDRLDRTAQLKTMMYLRGMEQTYVDLAQNPDIAAAVTGHVVEYFLAYNEHVFSEAGDLIDVFMMGDDFGAQHGPLVSPDLWRRLFRPGLQAYIDLAHRYGIPVMHHTCGSVVDLIPDFIDCGLDILQSLQPLAAGMDLARLKREFGRDLCFHGSIDIQHTLPRGTEQDVRDEVRRRMEAGKPGGAFIVCTAHNLQPDVPLGNILALFGAYEEFGSYA